MIVMSIDGIWTGVFLTLFVELVVFFLYHVYRDYKILHTYDSMQEEFRKALIDLDLATDKDLGEEDIYESDN